MIRAASVNSGNNFHHARFGPLALAGVFFCAYAGSTSIRNLPEISSVGERFWIVVGAVLAGLGVMAGAMGTHLLKETWQLPVEKLETFEVAVRYQMYHALALVLVGVLWPRFASRLLATAGWLLLVGIVLFSGGVYAYLASGIKPFVHVVPIGGTLWIVAWLLLALAVGIGKRKTV